MRLWSIHPKYVDSKGLVALWREALLAQKVLLGETKGYKNHPQLNRFKKANWYPINPDILAINIYLWHIFEESKKRNYKFNPNGEMIKDKGFVYCVKHPLKLTVTKGQLEYEFKHLQNKLEKRDMKKYQFNKMEVVDVISNNEYWRDNIKPHPLFKTVEGYIEKWEKIKRL